MDMNEKEKLINQAINNKEAIKIKYYSGSQPGAIRILVPVSLSEGNFRARYVNSQIRGTKIFNIKHVEFDFSDNEENYDFNIVKKSRSLSEKKEIYTSMADVMEKHADEIKSMGFSIESSDDWIGVFSFFKNGKKRKTTDISIAYNEFNEKLTFSLSWELTQEPSDRPYAVRAKSKTTRAFKYRDSAVEHFLVCVIDQFTQNCNKEKK